jgi:hypothetical protein
MPGAFSSEPKSLRWEINLQQPGLENFDRDEHRLWMEQQGVLFLTPEKILIYQVNRTAEPARLAHKGESGGAGNFWLNIRVLQVQDGRLIKSMNIVTTAGLSNVMATQNGSFLVRTGDVFYRYSADFQAVDSRPLPIEKVAPWEGWQMRVSPSGARVIVIHGQVFTHPEQLADRTILHDGQARLDVQVLNADTLVQEKTFSLDHVLTFWAPAENVLFSSNPAHSYSDGQVGTLDFEGQWSPIRADAPRETNTCGHGVSAIDDQRLVIVGCEEFTVVSRAGAKLLFSFKDPHCIFKQAAIGGRYLAVRCDRDTANGTRAGHWRPDRIELFDLHGYARLLAVPLHTEGVSYAVSAQGALAVIDGEKLRVYQVEKSS